MDWVFIIVSDNIEYLDQAFSIVRDNESFQVFVSPTDSDKLASPHVYTYIYKRKNSEADFSENIRRDIRCWRKEVQHSERAILGVRTRIGRGVLHTPPDVFG